MLQLLSGTTACNIETRLYYMLFEIIADVIIFMKKIHTFIHFVYCDDNYSLNKLQC